MQRRFLKISLITIMVIMFGLTVVVRATNDSVVDDLITGSNVSETVNDPVLGETDTDNSAQVTSDNTEDDTAIDNTVKENTETSTDADDEQEEVTTTGTQSTTTSSTYTPPSTVQPTQSYSTVATIPEANLSLNNILNVILIAVGVIIILLAIAILIKLK